MSKQKLQRNQEIYAKHKQGKSMYALALEYQITQPAVFKIIKREQKKEVKS
ncbi:MAG: Mor transcription activator family protein [Candidatus Levyibacteriota bacterium]